MACSRGRQRELLGSIVPNEDRGGGLLDGVTLRSSSASSILSRPGNAPDDIDEYGDGMVTGTDLGELPGGETEELPVEGGNDERGPRWRPDRPA
jgi:hypothetical protein